MSEHTPGDVKGTAPHLLYVAWGYPPSRGAGMYRALATANAFAKAGWRVSVLTATRETFETLTESDPSSEDHIDPTISVMRVPFDLSRGQNDLAKWSRLRAHSPLLWSVLKALRERRAFPENMYGGWYGPLVRAAAEIHRAQPVSLVIGSANPQVDFAPGQILHDRFRVPYVMDYRDTWHLDVYRDRRVGSKTSRSAKLERRLLASAHEVWFVNRPILDWHAREYPENSSHFHVVANGYDPEYVELARTRQRDAAKGLVFGYLGTVYGPLPLRETLDGWRLARAKSALVKHSTLVIRGRLGHYAAHDATTLALINEYANDGVSYGGPVSKQDVAEAYSTFDALLLILGNSRYVTSGKVFEYAASGLPVASLHDPETAATEVLRDYPRWSPAESVSAEHFAEAVIAAGERAASGSAADLVAAQNWAQHLSRHEQLAPRISALREFVDAGGTE